MSEGKQKINIVWFKKDLRLLDHNPLKTAIEAEKPLLLIYIFEPSLQKSKDWNIRHWQFIYHSILSLNRELEKFNTEIYIFYQEVETVFAYLLEKFEVENVFSHQETGIQITYQRDLRMQDFFQKHKIIWQEFQNNGVLRGLKNRKSWDYHWRKYMFGPQENPTLENIIPVSLGELDVAFWFDYKLNKELPSYPKQFQPVGEKNAWKYLRSFFKKRADNYTQHISKPEASRESCSRLSAYLTWGNLSIRQVYQYYQKEKEKSKFARNLKNFRSRLQWRDHFIQKFEMEDRIEFEPLNEAYLDLKKTRNKRFLRAWKEGKTGFPLVDACMRCVCETGYLNFRMRAMLVSFLTHHLWQTWREGVYFLAQQFLDYEVGIHFAQFQMQAGITGINTIRVYNPIKQSKEQDKEGVFIKKWIPELRTVPNTLVHEPYLMTMFEQQFYACFIGKDYPAPIVNLKESMQKAKDILFAWKDKEEVKEENKRILAKHVKPRTRKKISESIKPSEK